MTSAELSRWLDGIRSTAAVEAARWRSLRMPGDLKLDACTTDRIRLHAVGTLLSAIGKLAGVAVEHLDALRPGPACTCDNAMGLSHHHQTPGPWHKPSCPQHRPIAYSDGA